MTAGAPLRIALMLETDGPGGAETVLLQLAEELRRRGHDVMPVGPASGCGWLGGEFRARGFTPRTYVLRRPLDWACVTSLTALLRTHGSQVVHSHEFTMAVYGAAAARRAGARHVITMHGGRYYAEAWRRRAALRWAMARSAATTAVSGATAADLRRTVGVPDHAVRVVPNGIEMPRGRRELLRRELGLGDEELLIVAIGNLYPVKGHAVLVRALGELEQQGGTPPWRLAIAGRGEEEAPLRSLADDAGIAPRVHLLGFRSDAPDILAAGDIFVMPSLSEGLPLALVEAMATGLPIVASDVGGIPEVVARDAEAVLVPSASPNALAAAIRSLLVDPVRRAALGAAAQRRAHRDFSVDTMGNAYEALYRGAPGVCSEPRPATPDPAGERP
jgi:glycosyltransferase involved in cell wall biosynthesis